MSYLGLHVPLYTQLTVGSMSVQVSDGLGGSRVDQPQADGQSGASADPQNPHPLKRTYVT